MTTAYLANQESKDRRVTRRPAVTVVMPVRNEAEYIRAAIQAILANEFVDGSLEILVVDGMSDDATRDIVEQISCEHPEVRLLNNPMGTVPHALNLALREAAGSVYIRVDGHAIVDPDFIRSSLEELERHPDCACVGGPIENISPTPASRAIASAMSSPFGVGTAHFRTGGHEGYVDTLAFGAYRREVFEVVGDFDERLIRNQDDEFNFRLNKAGYRIWLSPRIKSRYMVRSDDSKLFRQYYQYGFWKVYVNQKHCQLTNLRQLAPATFLLLILILGLAALVSPLAFGVLALLLGTYLLTGLLFALRESREATSVLRIMRSFALMHFGYGLGYLEGVVRFAILGRGPRFRHAELSR